MYHIIIILQLLYLKFTKIFPRTRQFSHILQTRFGWHKWSREQRSFWIRVFRPSSECQILASFSATSWQTISFQNYYHHETRVAWGVWHTVVKQQKQPLGRESLVLRGEKHPSPHCTGGGAAKTPTCNHQVGSFSPTSRRWRGKLCLLKECTQFGPDKMKR